MSTTTEKEFLGEGVPEDTTATPVTEGEREQMSTNGEEPCAGGGCYDKQPVN